MAREWHRDEYVISTDKARLDLEAVESFLRASYWAADRPVDTIARSIENSLAFGIYKGKTQVGFARVVTDCATFAWLADVFVASEHRGRGLGKWLVGVALSHPDVQSVGRWFLATRDAQELYRQYGFVELERPERFMQRRKR